MNRDVSQHALKSLSCFTAVTFYSTSQLCANECFLNSNTMSILYFLSTIAKPLFFMIIGYTDSHDCLTRKVVTTKIKSIILIIIFWNFTLSFITFEYIQRGYILQNGIMLGMTIIYIIYPIIIKGKQNITITATIFVGLFATLILLDRFNPLDMKDDPLYLSSHSLIWIWIGYYTVGHFLGSLQGQHFTHRRSVLWLARIGIVPLGISMFFFERYLVTHTQDSVAIGFFIEHLHLLAVSLSLFILFDNITIKNPTLTRIVEFISPAMVGVYIVHYSVFYFITSLYDFNYATLKFTLLVLVFVASVLVSRALLLNKYTAWTISF